ncbi:MAG: hypothetical protein SV253_08830 [Halobacteria archaeon]|nr:hypothetical protein [Halobacteria archaeon]
MSLIINALIGVLSAVILVMLGINYLMHVRIKQLKEKVESLQSEVRLTDDEVEKLQSSINSIRKKER